MKVLVKNALAWWQNLKPIERVEKRSEYDQRNNLKCGHQLTDKIVKEIYSFELKS